MVDSFFYQKNILSYDKWKLKTTVSFNFFQLFIIKFYVELNIWYFNWILSCFCWKKKWTFMAKSRAHFLCKLKPSNGAEKKTVNLTTTRKIEKHIRRTAYSPSLTCITKVFYFVKCAFYVCIMYMYMCILNLFLAFLFIYFFFYSFD